MVLMEEGVGQGKRPWVFAPGDLLWVWSNASVLQSGESALMFRVGVGGNATSVCPQSV